MICEIEQSSMLAAKAAMIVLKLLDFQLNKHAEMVQKELGKVPPLLLSVFNLEQALNHDCCTKQILGILKAYLSA